MSCKDCIFWQGDESSYMAGCKQHNIRMSYDEPNCPQFTSKIVEPAKNYTQYYDCATTKNLGHGTVTRQPGGGIVYMPNGHPSIKVTYIHGVKSNTPKDIEAECKRILAIREAYRESHPIERIISTPAPDGLGGYLIPSPVLEKLRQHFDIWFPDNKTATKPPGILP